MRLLLTGFEPFGRSTINPSEQVVRALAAESLDGVSLAPLILPVEREEGPATLLRAVERDQPDAVLCLGEAGRRPAVSVERVAINLLDYAISDNAGNQLVDEPICSQGPAAYFVTLPARAIWAAINGAGVPVELSLSAGSFLCNQVTYELLHYLATRALPIPAGFIHLPFLPAQAASQRPVPPSMSLDTMCLAIRTAIRIIASGGVEEGGS
jgi:pyroglutamyl-peptidase